MLSVLVKDLSKVMYIPVTVDLEKIKVSKCAEKQGMKIFYGGSFGKKDGIEYLIGGYRSKEQTIRSHSISDGWRWKYFHPEPNGL